LRDSEISLLLGIQIPLTLIHLRITNRLLFLSPETFFFCLTTLRGCFPGRKTSSSPYFHSSRQGRKTEKDLLLFLLKLTFSSINECYTTLLSPFDKRETSLHRALSANQPPSPSLEDKSVRRAPSPFRDSLHPAPLPSLYAKKELSPLGACLRLPTPLFTFYALVRRLSLSFFPCPPLHFKDPYEWKSGFLPFLSLFGHKRQAALLGPFL